VKFILILFVLFNTHLFSKEVSIKYKFINYSNDQKLSFAQGNDNVFSTALRLTDSTGVYKINISEPVKLQILIDNNGKSLNSFWVDEQHDTVFIKIIRISNAEYKLTVLNSPLNKLYENRKILKKMYESKTDSLAKLKITDTKYKRIQNELSDLNQYMITTSHGVFFYDCTSFLGLDNLYFFLPFGEVPDSIKKVNFDCMDTSLQKYPMWQKCKDFLSQKKHKYQVGDTIEYSLFLNKDSLSVSIDTLIHKGKYTYLFLWSKGCHEAYVNAKKLTDFIYPKYKDKLDIISIGRSLDWQDWKQSIVANKSGFLDICDFKGYLSPLSYGISSDNAVDGILLDQNKKIISIHVYANDLEKLLAKNSKELTE